MCSSYTLGIVPLKALEVCDLDCVREVCVTGTVGPNADVQDGLEPVRG